MIVFGDATVLSQAVESGRIDATVVPGFLSGRLAEKGFIVLGRSDKTKLALVRGPNYGAQVEKTPTTMNL